jgi:hypothetical protein
MSALVRELFAACRRIRVARRAVVKQKSRDGDGHGEEEAEAEWHELLVDFDWCGRTDESMN